ncbi:MAG: zinc-ribbon domain-containing protein [Pirellulales bacterium]
MTCPKCGAKFRLAAEMAGRKGRCAKCGDVFRVPVATKPVANLAKTDSNTTGGGLSAADSGLKSQATSASETPPTRTPKPQPRPAPKPIAVHCRVCQTLMYGLPVQVGKSLKCPDCGALTVVPPPPPEEKVQQSPAAMQGDQYELWGVDEAPTVAEMIAAQPKYIAVLCHTCQTLMHATPEQIGRKLKCPDCGSLTVVERTEEPVRKPAAENDEYELEIDPTLDPGERPHIIVPPRRPMLYEEEAEAARKKAEERESQGKHRGLRHDNKGRAAMPRWPLVTGVVPFLFTGGVVARWVSLALSWYVLVSPFFLASQTQYGLLVALPFGIFTVFTLAVWTAALAAILMAVIVDSSEGNDHIEQWPTTNPIDWVGEFFYFAFACAASPLPGWLVGRFIADQAARVTFFLASTIMSLPVIILSQLEVGSAFAIASPRVIASLLRVPGSWLMFYVEMAVIWTCCVGLTIAAGLFSGYLLLALVPVYIGAALLSARILGRLAWKIAESTPVVEDEEATAA